MKNVVCADYHKSYAPTKTHKNHCVFTVDVDINEYQRSGLFPWGIKTQSYEGKKVISERAIKHIQNLINFASSQKKIKPLILFVVNRGDCSQLRISSDLCSVFAEKLKEATKAGVIVACFRVSWTGTGQAFFDGVIPVKIEV